MIVLSRTRRFFIWPLLFLAALAASRASASDSIDDLQFYTENYAPFNYEQNGEATGISVDVLATMLQRLGTSRTVKDIKVVPWPRGYDMALTKENVVLFLTTRTPAREKLFKWVGPVISINIVVIAKKTRSLEITGPEDLKHYRIATIKEDVGEQSLIEAGVPLDKIYRVNTPQSAAQMLNQDRVDLWAYGKIVGLWYMAQIGADPKDYEVIHTLRQSQDYFALNPETDDSVVERLQEALDQVRADGTLERIIDRYLAATP